MQRYTLLHNHSAAAILYASARQTKLSLHCCAGADFSQCGGIAGPTFVKTFVLVRRWNLSRI